jgi:drug/metabolite transporter superfamily protein YnfA
VRAARGSHTHTLTLLSYSEWLSHFCLVAVSDIAGCFLGCVVTRTPAFAWSFVHVSLIALFDSAFHGTMLDAVIGGQFVTRCLTHVPGSYPFQTL